MKSGRRVSLLVILIAVIVLGYNLFLHERSTEVDPAFVRLIQDGQLAKSEANSCCVDTSPPSKGDTEHPANTTNWVDTRLYFGLGPADAHGKGVPEKAWVDFLDSEVTPRFPSGLSVLDVYGQWQRKGDFRTERVRTKLLIIDYPSTPENEARIEAIRAAWKKRTGDQSVLKVTQPASVSF